ncbi:MAG: hypothetical protein V2A58_09710 [Planctomycetota bacterium]
MPLSNPIILKEFLQASHRRRTYILRTLIPLVAILILWPQIMITLGLYGQDWRAIQRIGRSLFVTCSWVELIAFSLLAFVYAQATIHDEWRSKTIEVLCATPLSSARIVYGKFVSVLGKVLLGVLALAPVLAVTYHLARIPREIALGTLAVVSGSVLFFGSAALAQAVLFRPSKLYGAAGAITILLPFYAAVIYLDVFVWKNHPVLDAAISPVALTMVLQGATPSSMSTGAFALLSFGIHVGAGALLLAASPWLFARTFARHIGSVRPLSGLLRLKRFLRGRRRPLKPNEDPFSWQEKGPPTRVLRFGLWVVYAVAALFSVGYAIEFNRSRFDFLDEEEFLMMMAVVGIAMLILESYLYSASVFSREKARRTAQSLLLTGTPPRRFLWAKIKALYRALRFSFAAVLLLSVFALIAVGVDLDDLDECVGAAFMMETLLLGPLVAAIIGMTFSIHAKTPSHAVLSLFASGIWMIVFGWVSAMGASILRSASKPVVFLLAGLLATGALLLASRRRWSAWRLSCLLACSAYVFGLALAAADYLLHYDMEALGMFIVGNVMAWALVALWLRIALRTFDDGLAGEPLVSKRHRV